MAYLYQLQFSNKKLYIGITTNSVEKRFRQHKNTARLGKSKLPVYEAWRKYGEPKLLILAEVEDKDINDAEIKAIQLYNALAPNGYNLAYGGLVAPTKNPEVAKKLSDSLQGRTLSNTHKLNMQEAHKQRTVYAKGYKHTLQAKNQISEALKGNKYAKGKPKSAETKAKMSASIKIALQRKKIIDRDKEQEYK